MPFAFDHAPTTGNFVYAGARRTTPTQACDDLADAMSDSRLRQLWARFQVHVVQRIHTALLGRRVEIQWLGDDRLVLRLFAEADRRCSAFTWLPLDELHKLPRWLDHYFPTIARAPRPPGASCCRGWHDGDSGLP